MTTDLVPAGITKKRPFLRLAEKRFFGKKSVEKKHLISAKTLLFIWENGTFLFAQLFLVVARTWCPLRSGCFFGPETSTKFF